MIIKCILVEDSPAECEHWSNQMTAWSSQHKLSILTKIYMDGASFLADEQYWKDCHVLFLDICLPDMTGIEIAHRISSLGYHLNIIFLTAYSEYVFEGYHVRAMDYLLKPISNEQLEQCMKRVLMQCNEDAYIFKDNETIYRVPYRDILYFTSERHKVIIRTVSKDYTVYNTFSSVMDNLPEQFIRIHRTLVINLLHLHALRGSWALISNGDELPVSRSYIQPLRIELMKHAIE